jgi:hypothetical protein
MQLLCRNYCGSSGVWVSAEGSRKGLTISKKIQRGLIHRRRFIEKELRLLRQESRAAAPIEAAAARCWLVSILNSTPERSLLSSRYRLRGRIWLCWHPVCTSNSARILWMEHIYAFHCDVQRSTHQADRIAAPVGLLFRFAAGQSDQETKRNDVTQQKTEPSAPSAAM